ncbi:MAG: DUF4168 domain-containing protein [Pseudoalteromonas prydzensis]|uniref:DUF4168 domain-containing protein n=2 Tax=root TaxID=1 RepID=A0A7V1GEI0_9GAMM|nr:DUF4168 domain-containing protein [Pseudoalteromonas prydzensis]HEA16312.1 DUF4168 domain-containing protein [Pseudoalteromonas prydzensis]
MKKNTIALCIAALSLSATAGMVNANTGVAVPPQQQTSSIKDAKLLQFSIAMDSIDKISTRYESEFQSAEDTEQAQTIQQRAQAEMVKAVEKAGLTVAEYSEIAQQAQQDPQLRERIMTMSRAE